MEVYSVFRVNILCAAFVLTVLQPVCKCDSGDVVLILDPEVDPAGWELGRLKSVNSSDEIPQAIVNIEPRIKNLPGKGIYYAKFTDYLQVLKDTNVVSHVSAQVNLKYYVHGNTALNITPIY